MSEAANLVFQWIFVLNSVKHKFFPVSIVKIESMHVVPTYSHQNVHIFDYACDTSLVFNLKEHQFNQWFLILCFELSDDSSSLQLNSGSGIFWEEHNLDSYQKTSDNSISQIYDFEFPKQWLLETLRNLAGQNYN